MGTDPVSNKIIQSTGARERLERLMVRRHPSDVSAALDAYRDEVLRKAADKILIAAYDNDGDTWLWQDSGEIPARCAELIDPDKEETA